MNRLSTVDRARVVTCLVEGNSLRATARITGVARMTVEKLLRDLGAACLAFHDTTVRNITSKRIQCDEIWSFCYAKNRAIQRDKTILDRNASAGDVWTWTALDADTKLMVSWLVAKRDLPSAKAFMQDVASRLAHRVQLTTDNYRLYLTAVDQAFGTDIDYAMLHKIYSSETSGRYSPPVCIGAKALNVSGDPDRKHVSTSYVERRNLTMRMSMRRFTRLTNGFSKKIEMHEYSSALHFMHYNFAKVHQTLRVTPAMEARLSDHVWSIEELIALVSDAATAQA
jgi:IS1 family transposase